MPRLLPANARTVFVNCPYDAEYKPTFDILVFAIHDCGFEAKFAKQLVGGGVRLTNIVAMINACSLSIHDICRVEASGPREKLPRFNMPFEAGIAYGRREADSRSHELLLIDNKPRRYQKTLSDAAGLDIKSYKKSAISVIECVTAFLEGWGPDVPGPDYVAARYAKFKRGLDKAAELKNHKGAKIRLWDNAVVLQQIMSDWLRPRK